MKLYKVYIVYRYTVVMHLYWAKNEEHVLELMPEEMRDKPKPIIKEIPQKINGGGCMCHHIADHGLGKRLLKNKDK